ncbi:MAG: NAD-dependent epimerase/dehydratase family protein [Dehalococcoidia bacterium]
MNSTQGSRNIFVTGGAGFIGSHLVSTLTSQGHRVTVYDNLVSSREGWPTRGLPEQDFSFIRADLLDQDALGKAMKGHDVVWHLAANTDIPGGNAITDLDLKNCTVATRNVLESMRQASIKELLFSSSACVYGDGALQPVDESFGPLMPISLYGAGKLACEGLISAYSHLFGIRSWVFRFANVVGSGMGHGVIHDCIAKLKTNGSELAILGDGAGQKPFFLVEDCIEGMLCAYDNSDEQCGVYNLGCESSTRISRVAQIVTEEMALKNVEFNYRGGARGWPGDAPVVQFNTSKMKKLGWEARGSSDDAVRAATRRLLDE